MGKISGMDERCYNGIAEINALDGGKISANKLVSLKTYGVDEYSRLKEDVLTQKLGEQTMEQIKGSFRKEEYYLAAARWAARGLKVHIAISKVKADQDKQYFKNR